MPTAGTPLSAMPSSVRSTSSVVQSSTIAVATDNTLDASSAATITLRRPMRSEINPAISIETASRPVVSDRVSALLAAETPKWRLNSGSSGCTV